MDIDLQSLRRLVARVSVLVGLLAFLNQAYNYAALDHALLMAVVTGLGVHVILITGVVGVNHILAYETPSSASASSPSDAEATSADSHAPDDHPE